jgi:hypothetical protein
VGTSMMMELEPGNTVELHGLAREDLNGTRGICIAYDVNKERWEVTTYGTTPKKLGVRPSNRVSSQRTEAMKALSTCLHERYPKKGFKFHPSLSFEVDEGGGVCIRTTANINMGEILIVVPSMLAYRPNIRRGSNFQMAHRCDKFLMTWLSGGKLAI